MNENLITKDSRKKYINCSKETKRLYQELSDREKTNLLAKGEPKPAKPLLTRLVEAEFSNYIDSNKIEILPDEFEFIKSTDGVLSNKHREKGIENEYGERIIRYGEMKLVPMVLHKDARNLMIWLANKQNLPLVTIVENIIKAEYKRVFPDDIATQGNLTKSSVPEEKGDCSIERLESKEVEKMLNNALAELKALHPFQISRFRPSIVRKLSIILSEIQTVSHNLHLGVLERVAKREGRERIKIEKMQKLIDKLYEEDVITEETYNSIVD